jgi:hypothetical protein
LNKKADALPVESLGNTGVQEQEEAHDDDLPGGRHPDRHLRRRGPGLRHPGDQRLEAIQTTTGPEAIQASSQGLSSDFRGYVTVPGQVIECRAYVLDPNTISVRK